MLKRIAIVGVVGLLVACSGSSSREGFDDSQGAGPGGSGVGGSGPIGGEQAGENPKADECQKMDIVFIVDDSGSMKEEQTNLAANFPKFTKVLDGFKTKSGSSLDWRMAVTTTGRDLKYNIELPGFGSLPQTEKGDNGAYRNKAACGASKRWVDKGDADATSRFSCLAEVGTAGPSIEMPLRALDLSLNDRVTDGTNAGFRRDDALLAVVVLTDEDDCSREDDNFTIQNDVCSTMANVKPVSDYVSMLDVAAKGAGRWATAVIAGEKSCSSSFGNAVEAKRLKEFVGLAGKNGTFSSICSGDLSGALEKALDTFDAACKSFPPVR
ncbi:MAG: hypothetical protein KF819_20500 [Labilithrix sp.]|nr:hypothetical protein [Labilithrix sp.]